MPSSCRIAGKLLVWTLRSGGASFAGGPGSEAPAERPVRAADRLRHRAAGCTCVAMFFSLARQGCRSGSGRERTSDGVGQRRGGRERGAHGRPRACGRSAPTRDGRSWESPSRSESVCDTIGGAWRRSLAGRSAGILKKKSVVDAYRDARARPSMRQVPSGVASTHPDGKGIGGRRKTLHQGVPKLRKSLMIT